MEPARELHVAAMVFKRYHSGMTITALRRSAR